MYMYPPSRPLMILIANVPKQTGWNREGDIKEMDFLKQGPGDMLTTQMTTHIRPFSVPKTTLISVGEQLDCVLNV